ncbi:MAG: hypothetical protein LW823_04160 [Rickettsiales bacterium]|jgi:hypothetical protein|nr:hypothetical protein [Rickettsiales bacterium]
MPFTPPLIEAEIAAITTNRNFLASEERKARFDEAIASLESMLEIYVKPESNKSNAQGLLQGIQAKLIAVISGSSFDKPATKEDKEAAEKKASLIIDTYKAHAERMYLDNVRALVPEDKKEAYDAAVLAIGSDAGNNRADTLAATQTIEQIFKDMKNEKAVTIANSVTTVARQAALRRTNPVEKPAVAAIG